MNNFLPLVIGLGLGGLGGYFAGQHGAAGTEPLTTAQREIVKLQSDLKSSQEAAQKLADEKSALATKAPDPDAKPDINKLFNDAKPLLKSFTAAMEPQRQEAIERMTEEQLKRMTALANLTPEQQESLKAYLAKLSDQEKAKWQATLNGDGGLAQLMKMGRNGPNPQKNLDEWAKTNLEGEQAQTYQTARLNEKAKAITDSANSKIETMSTSLNLDESQKDQMFHVLVRTDKNYDPAMQMEGIATTADGTVATESRDEAISAILNPEQQQKYEAQRAQKKQREGGFFKALGLPGNLAEE